MLGINKAAGLSSETEGFGLHEGRGISCFLPRESAGRH